MAFSRNISILHFQVCGRPVLCCACSGSINGPYVTTGHSIEVRAYRAHQGTHYPTHLEIWFTWRLGPRLLLLKSKDMTHTRGELNTFLQGFYENISKDKVAWVRTPSPPLCDNIEPVSNSHNSIGRGSHFSSYLKIQIFFLLLWQQGSKQNICTAGTVVGGMFGNKVNLYYRFALGFGGYIL